MTASSSKDAGYDAVLRLLNARTGLTFRADQQKSTRQGIERAMERSELANIDEFARLLEHDAQSLDNLVVELTVGETYFFREPGQLEYIKREILPEIRRRRGDDHTIRIWWASNGSADYLAVVECRNIDELREEMLRQFNVYRIRVAANPVPALSSSSGPGLHN